MPTVLEQINGIDNDLTAYKFGEVTAVYENSIAVTTTSGLEVKISSSGDSYSVGDQVVLGIDKANLNNLFVLKKLDRTYPNAINYVVDYDQD